MFDLMVLGLVKVLILYIEQKQLKAFTTMHTINPALLLRLLARLCQQTHSGRWFMPGVLVRPCGQQESGLKLLFFCENPGQVAEQYSTHSYMRRGKKRPLCCFFFFFTFPPLVWLSANYLMLYVEFLGIYSSE